MDIKDQALAIVQRWPDDKAAPARLAALYEANPAAAGDVGMFVEALYAAARDEGDLDLIDFTWEGLDVLDE